MNDVKSILEPIRVSESNSKKFIATNAYVKNLDHNK